MTLNEAAKILGWPRSEVVIALTDGIRLPKSGTPQKLRGQRVRSDWDITDTELDDFIQAFEAEEPGRHSPVAVRRELLVEARHRCAVCRAVAPLQFHHILEFNKVKHHDPTHMLAVCGTCHDRIGLGEIDSKAQRIYKDQLARISSETHESRLVPSGGPLRFRWDDLREIFTTLGGALPHLPTTDITSSRYDFTYTDIETKNQLNALSADYFEVIERRYEPHFHRVESFLKDPVNREISELYFDVVDELRARIASRQTSYSSFDDILIELRVATQRNFPELNRRGTLVSLVLAFMYANCDIGRKSSC